MTDYFDQITEAYAPTVDALRRAGFRTEVISTGGGCAAIALDGFGDDRAPDPMLHLELIPGGELTSERDSEFMWELMVYDGAEQLAYLPTIHYDIPDQDEALAETMAGLVGTILKWVTR